VSPSDTNKLLWAFAIILLALGIAQLLFMDGVASGAASIAIGSSLVAIAASTNKKQNDG
jgi:uncharacterized membrane protein